eukprot:1624195-Pyramimonas_sp.AAC.1
MWKEKTGATVASNTGSYPGSRCAAKKGALLASRRGRPAIAAAALLISASSSSDAPLAAAPRAAKGSRPARHSCATFVPTVRRRNRTLLSLRLSAVTRSSAMVRAMAVPRSSRTRFRARVSNGIRQ